MNHPHNRLAGLIYHPVRFSLLAAVAKADELEFRFLREVLEVSDSVLSRHVTALEEAGHVKVRKGYVGKRPRTWLSLTTDGRTEFDNHVRALTEIIESPALSDL